MTDPIIITCAVTGSVHTPTMSPYLPITPDEIAEQAIEAAEAGAAILHVHARDPETGQPASDPTLFMRFLPRIKQATDAVLNISTGGGMPMTVEQRMRAARRAAPEMASCNMGTMNFGLYPALERWTDWRYAWEPTFLEASRDFVFKNTFADIEALHRTLRDEHGTRFEYECYDLGHLYTLAHFLDRGIARPPLFVQFCLGVLGGIGADPDMLMTMKRAADNLFGADYRFSVLGVGRHQGPMATLGAALGGHVRVGLEDNVYLDKGVLAPSNAAQVRRVRQILEGLGRPVATPAEARTLLDLKGGDSVGF